MKNQRGRPAGSTQKTLDKSTIGGLLQWARINKGYGLKDVAKEVGVSVQYISNIEQNRAPMPFKYFTSVEKLLGLKEGKLQKMHLERFLSNQGVA